MTAEIEEARRYVDAALRLRRSIQYNRDDADFAARTGHEIVYIFDANAFVYYANVNEAGGLIDDIEELVGPGEGSAELSKAMGRLTADFLFSGLLPGQTKKRIGFISLSHFEESLEKASEIGTALDRVAGVDPTVSNDQIREEMRSIVHSEQPVVERLRQLGEMLPRAWIDALDAKAHLQRALRECFLTPGNLVPLDKRPGGLRAGVLDRDDLRPWLPLLHDKSRRRTPAAIDGDARTLATIVNLYRFDDTSIGRTRKTKYVLVTNDGNVSSAVRRRRKLLESEGIPFFVRSPRDYLPLLNLNAMWAAMDRVKPTDAMRERFKMVFQTLTSAVEWIALAADDTAAVQALMQDDGRLRELQAAWSAASGFVTVLNARHLAEQEAVFADLQSFMTGATETAATKLVEDSIRAVRDKHLSIALSAALADLARRPKHEALGPRRIHLQVITDNFGGAVPQGMDPHSYFDALIRDGKLTTEDANRIGADPQSTGAQLMVACLLIAADRWTAAVHAAGRAEELLLEQKRTGPELFDARYILAHALRFTLNTAYDLRRARRLLERNLAGYVQRESGMPFGWWRRLRDELELGSLLTTAAIQQALSRTSVGHRILGNRDGLRLHDKVPSEMLSEGVEMLRKAYERLVESEPLPDRNPERHQSTSTQFSRGLKMLATTNLIEAFVFERIAPGLQAKSSVADRAILPILEALGDEMAKSRNLGESLRPTQYVYYHRAKAILARNPDIRKRALVELHEHLASINGISGMPNIDALEFGFIAQELEVAAPH